ncbi:MAG TPA: tetratricopeptide repeat protein [Anaerolineales bacterium]|nr:tetratricopeptide repeat protein [Anaerolineales bacterium]
MAEERSPVVFNEWLKRRRKALYLTQDELAQRAGCSVSALRKIESGERRPSKQLAELLAKALEIPEEELQTFLRVARGELNIERLQPPASAPLPPISELWPPRQAQQIPSPANRIPLQATPLIGRDFELAALERLFNDPQCRLLTLTGMGGMGKTRLAIEFAARHVPVFPGGVFYVPLAAVNSSEKIIPAIADVLDFGFSGPSDPKEQLLNYIANEIVQEALFIFDNLEHLLLQAPAQEEATGLVGLVSEILQRLSNVKILGTSRERLNLHGEWTYELYGLSVPPTNFVGVLEEYDSIALFLRSAQRLKADYQITVDEQASLIQICQMVEGVPLAIELAAAWVGVLSCQEIAQEIKSNMDFLTSSMRNIPERHRSIRATFDHSWNLLAAEERRTLCQLAVFHGGFDRSAAQQIAGASLPILASLSFKSLLHRSEDGRYDLHELIRQYAFDHLTSQAQHLATHERHCEYYLAFVRDHENSLKSDSQQETVRQLTDEIDNIYAAWAWAIDHQKFAQLGGAGRAFGWYFEIAGLQREGIQQFELLVQALKARWHDDGLHRVLGLALNQQALLYFRKGENERGRKLYEESIAILRPTGDQTLLADALIFLGIIQHLNGDYVQSKLSLEEGLAFALAVEARWFEAYAIYNLGYIASLMGSYAEGYEQMLAGLAIWRELGDPHYIALGLNFLVPTLIKLGRYEEAKTYMRESIALCERAKNRWGMGTAYRYLGLASLAEGQFREAQVHLRKSLEIFGEYIVGWSIARSLTYLGDATLLAGDSEEARKIFQEALRSSLEAKAIPIALDALAGLCNLHARAGNIEKALVLCYHILNHSSSEEETKNRAEQQRQSLEANLSPRQVRAARLMAQEKTFDLIMQEALASY